VYEVHVDSVLMNGSPTMEYFFNLKDKSKRIPCLPSLKLLKS